MEGERYAVKWDLHRDIVMENFERMYSLNSLTDCVLMAGDREIHAHKLMLSSCSSYFRKLLEKTTDKVPVFIFHEMSFEELRSVIEYMYRGEVTVDQRTASRILKIGKDLKIEGLASDQNVKEKPSAHCPWGYQTGYAYGSSPQLPQNYGTPNNGWNYQNYAQPTPQPGFNNGTNSQSYNNYGNGMAKTPAGPSRPKNLTPSQALSGKLMDLISSNKIPETPKRKKDECFKSPPSSRKKTGKVYTELTPTTSNLEIKTGKVCTELTPTTSNLEIKTGKVYTELTPTTRNLEIKTGKVYTELTPTTRDLEIPLVPSIEKTEISQDENKDDEFTQEFSNIMNENENDEPPYTFPSLPPLKTSKPLSLSSYIGSEEIPDTSETISDIAIPVSFDNSDADNEASDSGINTSVAGTQDDHEENRSGPPTDETFQDIPKEITQGTPFQDGPQEMTQGTPNVSAMLFAKKLAKKSSKESTGDNDETETGGKYVLLSSMETGKEQSQPFPFYYSRGFFS